MDWKWECHPVVGLGEPCITSAQCRTRPGSPSHLCHPINHKCSCQRGFSPTVSTNYSLVCTEISTQVALLPTILSVTLCYSVTTICSKLQESVGYLSHVLWSPPALNISSSSSSSSSGRAGSQETETEGRERTSWVVLSLVVVGLGGAALLALLYLKTLQEKRASQARVKSLLRVVAEQGEMRPSLTSLTSFTSSLEDGLVEDCRDYRDYQPSQGEIYHLTAASTSILNNTIPVCHGETRARPNTETKSQIEKKILELQLPPSYDELLK